MEHFSTRVVLGGRAELRAAVDKYSSSKSFPRVELTSPLLFEGEIGVALSSKAKTLSYEQVLAYFGENVH